MASLQSNLDRFNAIFFSVEYIIDTHYRQFIGRLAVNDEHQSHIAVRRLYGERQDEMVTCYAIKCVVVNPRHAGIQELRLNLEEREKLPFLCGNGLHRRLLEFFRRTLAVTGHAPVRLPLQKKPDRVLRFTALFGENTSRCSSHPLNLTASFVARSPSTCRSVVDNHATAARMLVSLNSVSRKNGKSSRVPLPHTESDEPS